MVKALEVKEDGLVYAVEVPEEPIKTEYEHYYDVAWLTTLDLHRRAVQTAKESAILVSDQEKAQQKIIDSYLKRGDAPPFKYRGSLVIGIGEGIYPIPDLQWEIIDNTYIHEGSGKYWEDEPVKMKRLLNLPEEYAILKESTPSTEQESQEEDITRGFKRRIIEHVRNNPFESECNVVDCVLGLKDILKEFAATITRKP